MIILDLESKKYSDLILVTDSQDVSAVKEYCSKRSQAQKMDSFFVRIGEGEYTLIYGFIGCVPYLNKDVYLCKAYQPNFKLRKNNHI